MVKLFIFILSIYFLVILQASFFAFFDIRGYVFNFVLLAVFLFNILESQRKSGGLILAVFAGFFLDIFSSGLFGINFIGFWTLTLFVFSLLIKYLLKKNLSLG